MILGGYKSENDMFGETHVEMVVVGMNVNDKTNQLVMEEVHVQLVELKPWEDQHY